MRRAPALLAASAAAVALALHLDASYIWARQRALRHGRPAAAVVAGVAKLPAKGGQDMEAVGLRGDGVDGVAAVGPGAGIKAGDKLEVVVYENRLYLRDDGGFTAKRLALILALGGFLLGLGWSISTGRTLPE